MTALRSDFSSGKPLPASVASDSAASTSARRTVAGASTPLGAVTARCYPRSAPGEHAAGRSGAGPPAGRSPPHASHSSYAGHVRVSPASARPTGKAGSSRNVYWKAASTRGSTSQRRSAASRARQSRRRDARPPLRSPPTSGPPTPVSVTQIGLSRAHGRRSSAASSWSTGPRRRLGPAALGVGVLGVDGRRADHVVGQRGVELLDPGAAQPRAGQAGELGDRRGAARRAAPRARRASRGRAACRRRARPAATSGRRPRAAG